MLSLVTCTPSPGNIGSQRKVELWWQGGGGGGGQCQRRGKSHTSSEIQGIKDGGRKKRYRGANI